MRLPFALGAIVALICSPQLLAEDEGNAFFETRIRPVLVKHCYECHSSQAGELKGSLSLENAASVAKGGDSGAILTAGQPAKSLLIEALKYDGLEMPPAGKLPDEVIRDFEKWIEMGAPDPRSGDAAKVHAKAAIDIDSGRKFWAFQPPVKAPAPTVQNTSWPANWIDQFVLAEQESVGLVPSRDVDRSRLIRRVTLGLTGLPPTEEEVLNFVSDADPHALNKFVDRLLTTRSYAEAWARHWLDVARYADSNGGDFNATFHDAWRYRNYVIDAYAHDMPFDQFIREQLAGDLLESHSEEDSTRQLIATGFLVIGPKMLSERDKLKLTMDVVDEQVDTVGKALLGMTMGCARCHDHKFDPIPTADYYALAGIFRSTECLDGEIQKYVSDYVRRPLPIAPEHAAALAKYEGEMKTLDEALKTAKAKLKQAETDLKAVSASGSELVVDDKDAAKVGDWKNSVFSKPFVGEGYVHDDQKEKGAKSIRFSPKFTKSGMYDVRMSYTASGGRASNVPVVIQHADGKSELIVNQRKTPEIDGLYHLLGTFRFETDQAAFLEIGTKDTDGHVLADAVAFVAKDPVAGSITVDTSKLEAAVKAAQEELKQAEDAKKALEKTAPPPAPMAIAIREAKAATDCPICIRGEPRQLGPEVPRGFIQVAMTGNRPDLPKDTSGRRELADWITSPQNPLTARVYVNRVWQKLMGEGLVRSLDNFGELGERPTHPALLDRLTVEFIEHGWSTRWLIRQIVLSRTYSQDSQDRPEAFAIDPENRKLWRANRQRLTAEQLRDSLLAVSGQLQSSDAGSPVKGMGQIVVDNKPDADAFAESESFVRTIYLPVIRNEVSPLLAVFDFADPDFVVGKREATTVPAQALILLNNKFLVSSAERTTDRMFREASPSDDQRVDWAAMQLWSRPVSSDERRQIIEYLTRERSSGTDESAQKMAWTRTIHAMMASTGLLFVD